MPAGNVRRESPDQEKEGHDNRLLAKVDNDRQQNRLLLQQHRAPCDLDKQVFVKQSLEKRMLDEQTIENRRLGGIVDKQTIENRILNERTLGEHTDC